MSGEQFLYSKHSVMLLVLFGVFQVSVQQSEDNTGNMGPVGQQL